MSEVLEQATKLLAGMSRADKAELLQRVVRDMTDTFPGIESTPGISGGDACISGSRIPVWVLEQYRRLGKSEAELLLAYPTLHATDLANAWAYVAAHREEIDAAIDANEKA